MIRLLFLFIFLLGCSQLVERKCEVIPKVIKKKDQTVKQFCEKINKRFRKYGWRRIVCNPNTWNWDKQYISPKGHPLLYKEFTSGRPKSTTLIFCGVHGDELPVMYLCIHMVRDIIFDNPKLYNNQQVVVAPMINPDSFLIDNPTRQNGNGVDINRNFPTKDFDAKAIMQWKKSTRSSIRKYPGSVGGSEIETKFQMDLIERYKPDKIVSIHSPYGWLDVDSPNNIVNGDEPDGYDFRSFLMKSKIVAAEMSKRSNNYKVINFRVYPGSLGNYAAKERGIPTYTLELPTSSYRKAHEYWLQFRKALRGAVQFVIQVKE